MYIEIFGGWGWWGQRFLVVSGLCIVFHDMVGVRRYDLVSIGIFRVGD